MFHTAVERIRRNPYKNYTYVTPEEELLKAQRECSFAETIRFSIVVPCYETDRAYLRELIRSVLDQSYQDWELILADGSETDLVEKTQEEYRDERIRYVRLASNDGISANTNAAMQYVTGEYVALLDHDDLLTPDALFRVRTAIEEADGSPVFLFSDEDKTDESGSRFYEPHVKLDLNYDLILTNNYVCHLMVVRKDVIRRLGLRSSYDGAQDYDLVLRMVDDILERGLATPATLGRAVVHIPAVLYHWRCHTGSTADNPESKMYAYEAGLRAVEDCIRRRGLRATVEHAEHLGYYRIRHEIETLFADRPEIGAVGGPIYRRGKLVAGAMNLKGKLLWPDTGKHSSGYMNRIVSIQDVPALHMGNMILRRSVAEDFLREQGERYPGLVPVQAGLRGMESETVRLVMEGGRTVASSDTAASVALARYMAEQGYLLLYLPDMGTTIPGS